MKTFIIRFLDEDPIIVNAVCIEYAIMKAFNVEEGDVWNIMQGINFIELTSEQRKKLFNL